MQLDGQHMRVDGGALKVAASAACAQELVDQACLEQPAADTSQYEVSREADCLR